MSELETILTDIAQGAGIVGMIPSPASVPLLLFSGLEGPVVQGIALLIKKIRKKKVPAAAVAKALAVVDSEPDNPNPVDEAWEKDA